MMRLVASGASHIREPIKQNCWEKAFTYLFINDMIYLVYKTVKIILSNFIALYTMIFDGRHNPWI